MIAPTNIVLKPKNIHLIIHPSLKLKGVEYSMIPVVFNVHGVYQWEFFYDRKNHCFFLGVDNEAMAFALVNQYNWTMITATPIVWQKVVKKELLVRLGYNNIINWLQKILKTKTPGEIVAKFKLGD